MVSLRNGQNLTYETVRGEPVYTESGLQKTDFLINFFARGEPVHILLISVGTMLIPYLHIAYLFILNRNLCTQD